MDRRSITFSTFTIVLLLIAFAGPEARAQQAARNVVVNGVRLPDANIRALEAQYRTPIQDGAYWYDAASGAWGLWGGPGVGFLVPGLPLPGPVPENASNGNTGVYINGRHLPAQDLAALQQLVGVVQPGRYWLDGYGNAGPEGGPAVVNLVQIASRNRTWSHSNWYTGAGVGGSGGFSYYIDSDVGCTVVDGDVTC